MLGHIVKSGNSVEPSCRSDLKMMANHCLFWLLRFFLTQSCFTSSFLVESKEMNITLSIKHSRSFPTSRTTDARFAANGSITTNETAPESPRMAPTDNPSAKSTPHRIIEITVEYPMCSAFRTGYFTKSCSRKCSNETIFTEPNINSVCSCDRACVSVFMDCCSDYAAECIKAHDSDQPTDDFLYKQRTLMHCETKLNILQRMDRISAGVWMISKCPTIWRDNDVRMRCETPSFYLQVENYITYIPVFSHVTNLTYRNRYCALCNNISQYEFWNLSFAKNKYFISLYYTPKGFEEFLKYNLQDFMGLRPNDAQPIRYCHFPSAISSCPGGTSNVSVVDACVNGDVGLVRAVEKGRVFKNEHCALCNHVKGVCGVGQRIWQFIRVVSFLEINLRDGNFLKTPLCTHDSIYDPFVGQCRRNYERTWQFQNNTTADKYEVILSLENIGNFSMQHKKGGFLRKELSHVTGMNESQISNEEIISKTSEVLIRFTVSFTPLQSVIIGMQDGGLKNLFPMFSVPGLMFLGRWCIVYRYHARQLACIRQQVYSFQEYEVRNESNIYVYRTGVIYNPNQYYIDAKNANVTVCLKIKPLHCMQQLRELNQAEYNILPDLTLVFKSSRYNYGDYWYFKGMVYICVPLVIMESHLIEINIARTIIYESPIEIVIPTIRLSCFYRVYSFGEYVELGDQWIYVNATGMFHKKSDDHDRNLTDSKSNVSACLPGIPFQCNGTSIKLSPSEYRMENRTLMYKSKKYKFNEYTKLNGTVYVCVKMNYTRTYMTSLSTKNDVVLGYITIVGFILSLISLLALIVTYSIFQELRTLPGKNILALAVSMFLAELSWVCRIAFLENATAGCFSIAIANHYFFLVSFTASTVIAFHSCSMFARQVSLRRNNSYDKKKFFGYCLIVWGIPALFVLTTVLLDHFGLFITDYGRSRVCWLATNQSKIFLFIIPIGVLLLCNVLLFGFSAVCFLKNQNSISRTLGSDIVKSRQIQSILICVKLSTLMGFSWLFGLLQVIVKTETPVLTYLFVIFVSFQGLFISVAFLFKRRCLRLYHSLLEKTMSRKTATSSGKSRDIVVNGIRETKL